MPLKATLDNCFVLASDLTDNNRHGNYLCPICKDKFITVMPKKASIINHFRHTNGHNHGEPETMEHIQLKECVFSESQKLGYSADLEHIINLEREYIADVLVSNDKIKIAVECQCSPPGIEYVRSKTVYYWNNGYVPIWIFGIRWFDNAFFSNKHSRGYFIQRITGVEKWLWQRGFPIYYSNGDEEFYQFNNFKFRLASHGQQANGQELASYLGWFSISKTSLAEILKQCSSFDSKNSANAKE
jgi:competence CoiA-like predicted nuclease